MNDWQFPFEPTAYITRNGYEMRVDSTEWIKTDTLEEVQR